MNQDQATHKILEEIKDFNPGITIETCKMFEFYLNLGIAIGFDLGNAMRGLEKPVMRYSKFGNYINEYLSALDASRKLKIDNSSIGKVCNGKHKTAGGFIWKWK